MPGPRPTNCHPGWNRASFSRKHAKARPPRRSIAGWPRPVCKLRNNPFGAPNGYALRRVGGHVRLDDLVGVLHRLAALDLVDVLHALGHLAPHRVLVVEERCIVEADEELAVAGVRAGRACHRSGAAHMRLLVEFGLELLAGAAGAGAMRAAGLRHKALDHAM